MPSVTHEAPIELIRQCPPLALELVQAMIADGRDAGEPLPGQLEVSLGPTDLTEVVPATYLADAVVVASDPSTGQPVMVIIVEPQGRDDPTKEFSWPVYLTAVRRATGCRRAYLVIFAACMGAVSMEDEQGARQVLAAIRDTGASTADRKRLTTIILTLASDAARQLLEAMMTTTEWKSDFVEGFVRQGIEKGIEEGIQQGIEKGKAEYVLRTLDARGIAVTGEQRDQVTSCSDPAQLDRWFDRALTAKSAADVFRN